MIRAQRPGAIQVADSVRIEQTRSYGVVDWYLAGGVPPANCLAAWRSIGAVSYAASLVNLPNPGTYDLYEGTTPNWDAVNGWGGDGATMYLKTGLVPLNGYSVIARIASITASTYRMPMGMVQTASAQLQLNAYYNTSDSRYTYGDGLYLDTGNPVSSGVMAVTPTKAYLDGEELGSHGGTLAVGGIELYLLARNFQGSAQHYITGYLPCAAVYDIAIDPYVSALTAAMAALS